MSRYETIFLDRDGTLNHDPGYINKLESFKFYSFMDKVLTKFSSSGKKFCIITNQSGVGRGIIKMDDLSMIHDHVRKTFIEAGVNLLDIYFCPDHPDNASDMRKPGIGMFLEAKKDHGIDLSKSIMIGDGLTDIQAGFNLGIDTMLVLTGRGVKTRKMLTKIGQAPTYTARNLKTGLKYII